MGTAASLGRWHVSAWANIRRVDALLGTCSLPQLRRRRSAKWRTYPDDVLPAFVAEMDFDLAPPIGPAVAAALAIGDCGYPDKGALGEAYAAFAADRLGWDVDPGRVHPIPDVMTGLAEVVEAITPPGSGIVVNPPVYPPFRFRFGFYGRRIIDAPLARDEAGRYDLDPAAIEAALSQPGAAAYLLCSPHNPTGSVWSAGQLEMAADLCQRHGAALLVDEIHAPLVLPGARFVPFGSLRHEMAERAFVFTSGSKGWNIPGLKCGLVIAGSDRGSALLAERWQALIAATSASWRRWPPSPTGCRGSTRRFTSWTRTGRCWLTCCASACRPSGTHHRRPASWPGWTAGRWAWETTHRRCSWTRGGSRSAAALTSAARAAVSSG